MARMASRTCLLVFWSMSMSSTTSFTPRERKASFKPPRALTPPMLL